MFIVFIIYFKHQKRKVAHKMLVVLRLPNMIYNSLPPYPSPKERGVIRLDCWHFLYS